MAHDSAAQAIVKDLITHLKVKIPTLLKAYEDWPNPSESLSMPCLSIFAGSPRFEPLDPFIISKGAKDEDDLYLVKRVVGKWVFNLQVDLWASSKPERHKLFQDFFKAINQTPTVMGLRLKLTNYHDLYAAYSITGIDFMGSEMASQTSEWRVKATVICDVDEVLESLETMMESIENIFTIPEYIEPEADPSGPLI